MPRGGAMRHRRVCKAAISSEDTDSETESDSEPDPDSKNHMQTKQRLLHILSTEAAVCSKIQNDFTALHSSFDRWDSLLPHTTIHTILAFFGVSDTWLKFFAKFLEVPMRFTDDPANTTVRTRCRGNRTSHTLSDVFGEAVFFCLDFATNQATGGGLLYRLYDDAWFWSASHDANTFFTSNFGEAANWFGRAHVDAMLQTHSRIQREVFRDTSGFASSVKASSVVEYLKAVLRQRYGVEDIPDAFLFFPVELGGLDLQSPFVSILQVRDGILADPASLLEKFKKAELEAYRAAKERFESSNTSKNSNSGGGNQHWVPQDPGEARTFFGLEEYGRWREELEYGYDMELVDVYRQLLERPGQGGGIQMDDAGDVASGLAALNGAGAGQHAGLRGGIKLNWYGMEPYWRWVVALYGPEVVARFGGLRLVDSGLLPMGMVSLFREKRLSWQD